MVASTALPGIEVRVGSVADVGCDALVVPVFKDRKLPPFVRVLDGTLAAAIERRLSKEAFEGEIGHSLTIEVPKAGARWILIVGMGERKGFGRDAVRDAYGSASREALRRRFRRVCIAVPAGRGFFEHADAALEGWLLGGYRFNRYKKKPDEPLTVETLILSVDEGRLKTAVSTIVSKVSAVVESVFLARDLINEPANVATPEYIEGAAREVARESGLKLTVFDEKELRKRKMNLILAVGRGSAKRPRMLHLKLVPARGSQGTVVLVGKGVTFDSGGLSLKPYDYMAGMKSDMSGAAAVLGAVRAAARLKLPLTVHAVIPLVENLPGPDSVRPGDVVTGLADTSVEIENTDAEGRLILADALAYAKDLGADAVVDLATLTGSAIVALGDEIAALMSPEKRMVNDLASAGSRSGEKLWELPLERSYLKTLKSEVADLKNVGGKAAGTITAGLFLSEFAPKKGWAHIDIAGTAFIQREWPTCPKGATGFGVRTLVAWMTGFRRGKKK